MLNTNQFITALSESHNGNNPQGHQQHACEKQLRVSVQQSQVLQSTAAVSAVFGDQECEYNLATYLHKLHIMGAERSAKKAKEFFIEDAQFDIFCDGQLVHLHS